MAESAKAAYSRKKKHERRLRLRERLFHSFAAGVSSVIAVSGNFNLPAATSPNKDWIVLGNDWRQVGNYLMGAAEKLEPSQIER